MLNRTLNDTKCDFDIALTWCINAKNTLQNLDDFSPFQLTLGRNPKLPNLLTDKPPALSQPSGLASSILRDNLNALHSAQEAFIQSDRSECLCHALSHNVRTYADAVYLSCDRVYYKRVKDHKWEGPATVLGKDGQQVLIKHGRYYIRVHPCRLSPVETPSTTNPPPTTTVQEASQPAPPHNVEQPQPDSSSDDEATAIPPTPPLTPHYNIITEDL